MIKRSLTLVELIIAIVLLGVVVLGVMAFDSASRQFLRSSERKVEVLNELTLIMEHIHKNTLLGIGDANNPAIAVTESPGGVFNVTIRQDLATNGNPLNTPQNYGDDRAVRYIFDTRAGNNSVTYAVLNSGGGVVETQVLANNMLRLTDESGTLTLDMQRTSLGEGVMAGGIVINNLTFRMRADEEYDAKDNPEVTIDRQYFFPLSQSSN